MLPEEFDDEELNRFYIEYKESMNGINENWLKENKNSYLKEWTEDFFQEWDLYTNSNMLRSRFKAKIREFKRNHRYPVVTFKGLMELSQNELISSYEDIVGIMENNKHK